MVPSLELKRHKAAVAASAAADTAAGCFLQPSDSRTLLLLVLLLLLLLLLLLWQLLQLLLLPLLP